MRVKGIRFRVRGFWGLPLEALAKLELGSSTGSTRHLYRFIMFNKRACIVGIGFGERLLLWYSHFGDL